MNTQNATPEEADLEHNAPILDEIMRLTKELKAGPSTPTRLPTSPRERARDALQLAGYYPTDAGVEMMQDPAERAATLQNLMLDAGKLEPGDLFAVAVLVSSLTWQPNGTGID